MNYQQFLTILWSQKASGESGFEGLIRKLLEKVTKQRFFLSSSGRQEGRDIANEIGIGNFIAIECKRYKESTSLTSDELLAKLIRAAISDPRPDLWIVVTTKRLGEQHHRDLKRTSQEFGISCFCIDAEGEEKSFLVALCASAPEIVASHLMANLPKVDESIANEIKSYLFELANGEDVLRSVEFVRNFISQDTIGYADWKNKQNNWLIKQFCSQQNSEAMFGQNLAVRSSKYKIVKRDQSRKALDDWWDRWQEDEFQKMIVLGEEGDGKSWLVADWLADQLTQEGFPPVLFIPSTQFNETDPLKFVIQTILRQIEKHQESYWEKRITRWMDSSQESPVFLLVLDGLNERPGFNWRHFLSRLDASPYTDRIAVLITCRSIFWSERIGFDESLCEIFTIQPYDDKELDRALELEGLQRGAFDDKLLPLLSKPRYFNLTLKLKDRLAEQGDVTIERLIYEDWRDQISRKKGCDGLLSNDEFQELIIELSKKWSAQGMLGRKDIYSELSMYGDGKALLDEMRYGSILRKDGNRWQINSHYLILGLGLLLADEVEQTVPEGEAAVDELIARRLEPQPDMDLKVSICGISFLHSLICREEYPDSGRLALFRAWLRGRNIKIEDWHRIPAYLPLRPPIYFKMAEYIWSKAGENQEAQDAFMSGFLKYGGQGKVLSKTVIAFERWMGFIHPYGHHGRHAQNEEERNKGREEVRNVLGKSIEQGGFNFYGYPLEIIDEEGWLRLSAVALSVISHQKRKPYTRALTIYTLASTIMGYPGYQSAFNWVIRTSPDDIEGNLLSASQQLMDIGEFATQRAAWWLLTGLCSEEGVNLRKQIPAEYRFKNILYKHYEKEPCNSLFSWEQSTYLNCIEECHQNPTFMARQLKEVALNPELNFPEEFVPILKNVGEHQDFSAVQNSLNRTGVDLLLEEIEPALCAWSPEGFAKIWYYLTSLLVDRTGLNRRLLSFGVYDHLLIMREKEMRLLENAWHTALQSEQKEEKNAEMILFPCVLWGKDLKTQLNMIEKRGDRGGYFGGHRPFIQQLREEDLPIIISYLKKFSESNGEPAVSLLSHIADDPPVLNWEIKNLLVSIFNTGNSKARGICLEIFSKAREADVINTLLEIDWRIDTAGSDYEKYWGSIFFCKYGTDLPFKKIVSRILPEKIGYAIQCRNNRTEEIMAFGKFIHETWKSISSDIPLKFNKAELTKVEVAWIEKDEENNKNWTICSANEGTTFKSWDSIWGGEVKKTDKNDITDIFNSEKMIRKYNEANKQLYDLVKSESKSGNPWFLSSAKPLIIEEVIDIHPNYIKEWVRAVLNNSPDSYSLIVRCRSFYESLCKVLLNRMPELGVSLFRHLRTINDFQLSDNVTKIDSLLFCIFSAKGSTPVVSLQNELIENSTCDKDLFDIAFLSQFNENQEWLFEKIDLWFGSNRMYDQTRGLTLLGFMDGALSSERLQEWIDNHIESWPRNCAEYALGINQRNIWAKKWFTTFLSHKNDLHAWAAFRLFRRCIDRRFWLWEQEKIATAEKTNRIDYFHANKPDLQKAAIKNEKDTLKLEKRFLFNDIQKNQTWPWMAQYF